MKASFGFFANSFFQKTCSPNLFPFLYFVKTQKRKEKLEKIFFFFSLFGVSPPKSEMFNGKWGHSKKNRILQKNVQAFKFWLRNGKSLSFLSFFLGAKKVFCNTNLFCFQKNGLFFSFFFFLFSSLFLFSVLFFFSARTNVFQKKEQRRKRRGAVKKRKIIKSESPKKKDSEREIF